MVLDKAWANELLSYSTRQLYDKSTWNLPHNIQNKIIVTQCNIDLLESAGFWWQAQRLANHLHRWIRDVYKGVYDAEASIPSREEELHC